MLKSFSIQNGKMNVLPHTVATQDQAGGWAQKPSLGWMGSYSWGFTVPALPAALCAGWLLGMETQLLWLTIQLLFFSLALFSGYIQILDSWHHPYDGVFGFLQGALMAS